MLEALAPHARHRAGLWQLTLARGPSDAEAPDFSKHPKDTEAQSFIQAFPESGPRGLGFRV